MKKIYVLMIALGTIQIASADEIHGSDGPLLTCTSPDEDIVRYRFELSRIGAALFQGELSSVRGIDTQKDEGVFVCEKLDEAPSSVQRLWSCTQTGGAFNNPHLIGIEQGGITGNHIQAYLGIRQMFPEPMKRVAAMSCRRKR